MTSEITFAPPGIKGSLLIPRFNTLPFLREEGFLHIQEEVERLVPISVLRTRLAGRIVVIINEKGLVSFLGKYSRGFTVSKESIFCFTAAGKVKVKTKSISSEK